MNFSKAIRVEPILAYASGSSDRTSSIVDTKGYDSLAILVHAHVVPVGGGTVKLQGGHKSDLSDVQDIEDTAQALVDADDDKIVILDTSNVRFRYVRLSVVKTGTAAESAIAALYNGRTEPAAQPSTTLSEFNFGVGAGTA